MLDITTPSSLANKASPTLSRRALVAGVTVSALAGPAVAAAAPRADAAVLDLAHDLDAAAHRAVAAADAARAALGRVVHPEAPLALFWRLGDDDIGVLQPTYFRDGLAWYGPEVDLVARCRPRRPCSSPCGRYSGFEPDPEGVARVAEIVAADRAWRAEKASAYAAAGVTEASAASDAAGRDVRRLMAELTAAPSLTLAGVLAKARAVADAFDGVEVLAEEIGPEPDGTAETMALAVVRDLLRLADAGKENARG